MRRIAPEAQRVRDLAVRGARSLSERPRRDCDLLRLHRAEPPDHLRRGPERRPEEVLDVEADPSEGLPLHRTNDSRGAPLSAEPV